MIVLNEMFVEIRLVCLVVLRIFGKVFDLKLFVNVFEVLVEL